MYSSFVFTTSVPSKFPDSKETEPGVKLLAQLYQHTATRIQPQFKKKIAVELTVLPTEHQEDFTPSPDEE